MAGSPPILSSRSFKGQKALTGKQFRTGALGRALNDIYGDIDTAFLDLEGKSAADAITAVEGEATLDLTGSVTLATAKSLTINGGLAGPRLVVTNTTGDQVVARFTGGDGTTEILGGTNIDMGRAGANRIRCGNASGSFAITTGGLANTRFTVESGGKVLISNTGSEIEKGTTVAIDEAATTEVEENSRRAGTISFTNDGAWADDAEKIVTLQGDLLKASDAYAVTANRAIQATPQSAANGSVVIRLVNRIGGTLADDSVTLINWVAL